MSSLLIGNNCHCQFVFTSFCSEVISDHAPCTDLNVDELLNRYHSCELSHNKTNDHDDCGRHCGNDIKKTGNDSTFV